MKQRIIKFRIWDNQNQIFVENSSSLHCFSNWSIDTFTGEIIDYIGTLGIEPTYSQNKNPNLYIKNLKAVKKPRYILQQFTGLKDFKKREIYEGDILVSDQDKSYKHNYRVRYYNASFDLISASDDGDEYGTYTVDLERAIQMKNATIIGNIFENPKLLKKS